LFLFLPKGAHIREGEKKTHLSPSFPIFVRSITSAGKQKEKRFKKNSSAKKAEQKAPKK
jgi:hypothetical protein